MDILKRSLAPVTDEAWSEIDDQAAEILKNQLTGRKIDRRSRLRFFI